MVVWRVIMLLAAFVTVMAMASMTSKAHASTVGDQPGASFSMIDDAVLADKPGCCDQGFVCGNSGHCASCVGALTAVASQTVAFDVVRITFPSEPVRRQSLPMAPEKAPPRLV